MKWLGAGSAGAGGEPAPPMQLHHPSANGHLPITVRLDIHFKYSLIKPLPPSPLLHSLLSYLPDSGFFIFFHFILDLCLFFSYPQLPHLVCTSFHRLASNLFGCVCIEPLSVNNNILLFVIIIIFSNLVFLSLLNLLNVKSQIFLNT